MNLDTYKSFEGRIGRQTWWLSQIVMGLVMMIPYGIIIGLMYATTDTSGPEPVPSTLGLAIAGVIGLLMIIVLFWASFAINAKRWHDHGKSGWYQLLGLIPFVNIWVFIKAGFLRGTEGPNEFGPDPIAD